MITSPFLSLLADFAEAASLPPPSTDEQGFIVLQADSMAVFLRSSADTLEMEFFGEIGRLAETPPQELLEELLQANLAWQGTHGATLGLDCKTRMLMICARRPLQGMTLQSFQQTLEDFLQTMTHWVQKININQKERSATASHGEMDTRWRV